MRKTLCILLMSLCFQVIPAKAQSSSDIDISKLLSILMQFDVTTDDLPYVQDTILPLYLNLMQNRNVPEESALKYELDTIAKAPFDGCYFEIGDWLNTYKTSGVDTCLCRQSFNTNGVYGKPKVNGAYPWGVVQVGKKIFWGTVNNILCIPSWQGITSLNTFEPYENDCWVCEYDKGVRKGVGANGDILRPTVYMYDTETGVITDFTKKLKSASVLDDCLGLRSAGTLNGVVFIGGPGLDSDAGQQSTSSAFIAFDADGNYLGQSDMSNVDGCKVTDVRRWLVHEGVLYVGVGIVDQNGISKGAVLRWYGDKEEPFNFHVVGYTACEAGEICVHNGRIYAGGWPTANLPQSAIFEGPEIPEGGYDPANASEWEIKWKIDQYEPNAACRRYSQCSLLRSYKGKLYWSMWFPQYGLPALLRQGGVDIKSVRGMGAFLALFRQATLWRTDDFSEIEMLYGEDNLSNYNFATGDLTVSQPNNSGYKKVYGRAGFDRQFTAYMWASEEYNDNLYIGTMSTENLLEPALGNSSNDDATKAVLSAAIGLLGVQEENKGYELYLFKDNESPAETVTQDGFGNHAQYGIRNIVLSEDKSDMYIGTASPFNLHEYGGWRILKLHDNDYVAPPTGIKAATFKPAAILMKSEDGYVTFSSLLGEKITNIQVTDLSGRQVYSEVPANNEAYLFNSQTGTGMFLVTLTTKSGSWTTKVVMK